MTIRPHLSLIATFSFGLLVCALVAASIAYAADAPSATTGSAKDVAQNGATLVATHRSARIHCVTFIRKRSEAALLPAGGVSTERTRYVIRASVIHPRRRSMTRPPSMVPEIVRVPRASRAAPGGRSVP